MLKIKYATVVYQGGMANVFTHDFDGLELANLKLPLNPNIKRIMQQDFRSCEYFACGLAAAGVKVRSAWCNEAGDIAKSKWNFENLDDAPFSGQFRLVNA